jgi:hypothetical protein
MPLLDKKIPGWLKGAVAGMLLLTVGHFIHQTFFVGWRTYYVLIFTDLPPDRTEWHYQIYLDGIDRRHTISIAPAPGDTFRLASVEPLRLPKRRVTLSLVPLPRNTAHPTYEFEIENNFEGQVDCHIVVRLRSGAPTVDGCVRMSYDASNFSFFVNSVN